jgi:hypothetical protein
MTSERMLALLQRWRLNPAEWASKFYKIRNKQQQLVNFVFKPAQADLAIREAAQRKKRGYVRQYILKARQGGFTTYAQMRNLHLIWAQPNIDALTIADKLDRTQKIFKITERAIQHLPPELTPEIGKRRAMGVQFPKLDSEFHTDTAGSGDPARGLTIGRLHGSEFAHWAKPRDVLSACMPSVIPSGVITLETTASMLDDEAHQFWVAAVNGENGYEAIFYPWWECDPDYKMQLVEPDELGKLSDEEQLLLRRYPLSPEQIKWRRETMRELGRPHFLREYAEDPDSCWMAAGELLYDAEMLKALLANAAIPLSGFDPALQEYRHHLPPGNRMIIGADVAEGQGGDASTWEAEAFPSGASMSTYHSANIAPEPFADKLYAYASRHNFPIIVIEKNQHGITVIRRLKDVHRYPIERLYHRLSYSQAMMRPTRELGWYTSSESKPLMIDAMRMRFNAAMAGGIPLSKRAVRDAFRVRYDDHGTLVLTGRDNFVAASLASLGRAYPYIPLGNQLPPTVMGHAT